MDPRAAADPQKMSSLTARALAPLLAALALALGAAGCGSSATTTLDPIAQAAKATTHSGGSQIMMTVSISSPQLGSSPVTVKGNGDFNQATEEGELFFTLNGLPASALASLPSGNLTITELYKSGVIYMSSPLFEGKLPGGAKWMKLDLAKFESSLGIDPQDLTSGQNPAQYLQFLQASGGVVKPAGTETVRGTPTTRYEGAIDLDKLAESIPSSNRAALQKSVQKLITQAGVSSFPVTVWIDHAHLIRRMQMKIPLGSAGSASIDYELFGFGATPTVNPPSSSETFDATNLGLQGLSGG